MTRYYLDTSVAVHALDGHPRATEWFDQAIGESDVVSSRLLQTELTRFLRRVALPINMRDALLDKVTMAVLDEATMSSAEANTEHAKTLDAIHLATAVALGSDTVIVSHDANVLRLAAELGLRTLDPVTQS
ncbi:type II toxin-antitoxin system VapC family toxin [Demequina sp.]|uniref:type II toxin-antitoxin system VapC family toxin n=1 Tax=Demequina sp. TaxID=2050685 RepID=UPI003D0AA76C